MPRFFFNLHDDIVVIDTEGLVLADTDAAFTSALYTARELACAEVQRGALNPRHRLEIIDDARQLVGVVTFATATGLDLLGDKQGDLDGQKT